MTGDSTIDFVRFSHSVSLLILEQLYFKSFQTHFCHCSAGAEMGLRLIINIEEYDHAKYYSSDAGIRVNFNLAMACINCN